MEGKAKIGRVVGAKMDKTVVVVVESVRMHRLYQKPVKRTRRFKAHDAANSCKVGDLVRIVESRPLSKEKRWRVAAILKKGETIQVEA